jgi:ribonucleoside-diphosphate reductase alpha chain
MSELLPHQKKIAEKRYFQLDEKSWEDMVNTRVFPTVMANELQAQEDSGWTDERLEKITRKSRELLVSRSFLFNTPTWINAGLPGARTLSACFVGELKDDMLGEGGILDCSRWFGTVQKFGGGTGIDLSALRAKGSPIKSTHGKACGPLMVLKYLAATSQMITQGGARDGANMAVMSVYHEDIVDFITCKSTESKYMLELPREIAQAKVDAGEWTVEAGQTYIDYCKRMGVYQLFNMSVAVDNRFMKAVQAYIGKDGKWTEFDDPEYVLPCGKTIAEIWNLMIDESHASGDPGILFMERAQEFARFHSVYIPWATNPCGEQFLPEHGSCNLGSIDLAKFVEHDNLVHWDALEEAIRLAVRMLDNVVSINKHPVDKIGQVNQDERRIGLGVMGWADVLFKMKIPYDSEKALEKAHEFASFFKRIAHEASVELAVERGAFPLCEIVLQQAQESPLDLAKINMSPDVDEPYMPILHRRNATVTTVAPTGTISLMAGCSSGIEPHFLLCYEHDGLAEHGGLGYIWASDTLRNMYEANEGVTKGNWGCPDEFETYIREEYGWKPANEIEIGYHVQHQAVWQKYIDNSISKTLNLPNSATKFQVAQTFLLSYSLGCKGSTVYRDGCKPFQPLNAPKVQKCKKPALCGCEDCLQAQAEQFVADNPMPAPPTDVVVPGERIKKRREEIAHGVTVKVKTGDGSLYVVINRGVRDEPFEVFAIVGKAGGKAAAYTEAIGRLISMALQYNIPIGDIRRELRGIAGGEPYGLGPNRVLSVPDGIGKALEKFIEYEIEEADEADEIEVAPTVPVTRETALVDACPECGFSKCQ